MGAGAGAGGLAARLAARIALSAGQARWPRVVFIDGRSGSGKTTLAEGLAAELVRSGCPAPQIVGMDELYPGWGGLAAGSAAVAGLLRTGVYRRYDWYAETFTPEVVLDLASPVIVEGCGSLSAAALGAASGLAAPAGLGASYSVWVECPAPLRRARALARDGETFAPHWENWASQEAAHFAVSQPLARVNEIVHVA